MGGWHGDSGVMSMCGGGMGTVVSQHVWWWHKGGVMSMCGGAGDSGVMSRVVVAWGQVR